MQHPRHKPVKKEMEAVFRESEKRYRALFDLGPMALYCCNASGVVVEFNHRAEEMWGRKPVAGNSHERFCGAFKLFRPDGSFMPHNKCPMADVLQGKVTAVQNAEVVIERQDGSRITAVVNIHPLKDKRGQITGAINCFYNVTQQKQAEMGMQMFTQEIVAAREEERKRVSTALHHDVGSLVVGIAANLDAIEGDLCSKKTGEALLWIKRTRDLLEKSGLRLKALAVELRPPELDVLGPRAALREYFSQITKRRGARIHFSDTNCSNRVSANAATILFRVSQEAVTNAIKHGHAKQVWVDLRTSKEKIRLTIRDDGKGFDLSEQKARISSQLGLRVMEEMATSAGGDFIVDSGRGRGTTVRLNLPMETAGSAVRSSQPPKGSRP
jgi:PAS domain S-box-containing protein